MAEYYTSTKHFRKKVGKSQTVPTTDYTPYDPIEIARQYAPKFDKPVVDMVAVVRCKDCKYRYGDKDEPYCSRINPYSGMRVEDEDFCSWGERKDEVENGKNSR